MRSWGSGMACDGLYMEVWLAMRSMFILSELQDIVRIEPHKFFQDMEQQIRDELNKKFANKVSRNK